MLDWFRSWHGAPTDPKWLVIGKRAGVAPGVVSAIIWALFDHASRNEEDRGDVADFDLETYSAFSGFEEDKVRAVYSALEAKGIIVSGRIYQWEKRQPKREDNSTERMRKIRKGSEVQSSLPLAAEEQTEREPPPVPPAELSATESKTTTIEPLISAEARTLADEIIVAVGHDLGFVPPGWHGAADKVHTWLKNKWPPEIILRSVKAQMHRKRDGPPDRIQYFEKGIARAIAEQSAPLPTVVPFRAESVHAQHAKPENSIIAAQHRLLAELEGGSSPLRDGAPGLLSERRCQ